MSQTGSVVSGRNNDLLWLAVGLIGVLGISYFYVAPQMSSLRQARAVTLAKADDIQKLQDEITKTNEIGLSLAGQKDALNQLALAAPATASFDQILVALQAIASQSGVILSSVQPVASTTSQQATATIALKGTYDGVHLFLENLAKNIRPVSVTNMALVSATDNSGASLLNATLTITAAQAQTIAPAATSGGNQS
jgi:Tfp pilus assembly protein PilO